MLATGLLCGCVPQEPAAPAVRCDTTIEGKVLERLDRPPYSFLRVAAADGAVWVAVPAGDITPGGVVRARATAMLRNHPVGAGRRLDAVCFGTLLD